MNLVDTSGWIAYFFEGGNAAFFSQAIENTDELVISVVCIYEVFKKVNLVSDESKALRSVAQMKQGIVIDVSEEIAMKAALLSIEHRLPMADSMIYATALSEKARVWTQDAHFEHLQGVKYIEKPPPEPS
jgi:predicted nucleic acid-binding protein